MDNTQQPIQPQQENNQLPTNPVSPEPKKNEILIYILAGLLIVGVAVTAGIFLNEKSSKNEIAPIAENPQIPSTNLLPK